MSRSSARDNVEQTAEYAAIGEKKSFINWFLVLVILVFVVVVWGALVRLTGSGLSIPEWPIINGSLLPPLSSGDWLAVYKTYYLEVHDITDITVAGVMPLSEFKTMFAIEYIHRLIAAVVGVLFLVLAIQVWRKKSRRGLIGKIMAAALVLLLLQIILGGIVVREELKAQLVAFHLGAAYLFFAMILWAYLKISSPHAARQHSADSNRVSTAAWIATCVLFLQIISGGLMAGSGAGFMLNTFPKIGDVWVPSLSILFSGAYGGFFANLFQNQVLIQFIHRWWILAVIVAIGFIHAKAMKAGLSPRGRLAILAAGTVLILQLLLGIGNLVMKVPFYMSISHSATALVLFALMVITTFEVTSRGKPVDA